MPTRPVVIGGGGGGGGALDDDEQMMFEQRLAHDELGVAIRKISHSGKAQLRYVKCVPIRPPSSSDYVDATDDIVRPPPAQQRAAHVPPAHVAVAAAPQAGAIRWKVHPPVCAAPL